MDSNLIIADIDCDDGHYSFKFVAETSENDILGRANAQFIVKACNEHYADKAKIREQEQLIGELIEALRKDSSRFKRVLQTIDDIVMVGNGTRKAELMNYIQQCEVETSEEINKATEGR